MVSHTCLLERVKIMLNLVRVDDRLLHGQIICSWVPFVDADVLIVASDEAAADRDLKDIMGSCAHPGLRVEVKKVDEIAGELASSGTAEGNVILILADLKDALRVYEQGVRFKTLNIGNLHHDSNGREITPSVIIDDKDEEILERLVADGVGIDIRNVPASKPAAYSPRKEEGV